MTITGCLRSILKSAANSCGAILGVLLGIIVTPTASGVFAQDERIVSYSVLDGSSEQVIQEGKITGRKEPTNAKKEEVPRNRVEKYLRVQRPVHYTLLTTQLQGILQNRSVSEISDTAYKTPVNILLNQELRLASDPQEHKPALIWGRDSGMPIRAEPVPVSSSGMIRSPIS